MSQTLSTDVGVAPIKAARPTRSRLMLVTKVLVVSAVALVACELYWRIDGARPTQSDVLMFARNRQLVRNSTRAVALLGSSRVLAGLDPRVMKHQAPDRDFIQLAISGQSGLPLLEDLAHDPKFIALAVCEYNPAHFWSGYPFRKDEPFLRYTHQSPYGEFVDTWITEHVKEHLAFISQNFWESLSRKIAPTPPVSVYRRQRDDRFLVLQMAERDNSAQIAQWRQQAALAWDESSRATGGRAFQRIPEWVAAIRRRGGDVVFVRMPVTGSLKRIEQEYYPNDRELAASLAPQNIVLVDSRLEPALAAFRCADESHLDASDAALFSTAFTSILESRGLLYSRATSR
jgi:hypothetical protein